MRTLPGSILFSMLFATWAPAAESDADLARRAAEQERQIRQLEVENQHLRDQIDRLQEKLLAFEQPEGEPAAEEGQPAPAPAPEPEADAGHELHVVRAGESLSKIARRYGTTTEALAELNHISNPALIREGQKLKLPAAGKPVAAPSEADQGTVEGTHRVKPGETLYSIAKIYGLSVEALAAANPEIDPRKLRVGQELKLSAKKVTTEPAEPESEPATLPSSGRMEPRRESTQAVSRHRVIRSVPIEENISFGEFAERHQMEPAKLNALNGLQLEPQTVLATGSRLYVSAQPLE